MVCTSRFSPSLSHGLCAFFASNSRFMRLFWAALDTCLDSLFLASLSVHGLHFTVYAPSNCFKLGAKWWQDLATGSLKGVHSRNGPLRAKSANLWDSCLIPWSCLSSASPRVSHKRVFTLICWQPGSANTGYCSIWAISRCGISGVNSANTPLCDTLAFSHFFPGDVEGAKLLPKYKNRSQGLICRKHVASEGIVRVAPLQNKIAPIPLTQKLKRSETIWFPNYRSSQNYHWQSCYYWEFISRKLPLPSWNSDELPLPLPSWPLQSPLHFHWLPITV